MDKKIKISIPEELFNKLEEEAIKNHLSLDELILRKLNKIYSDSNGGYLTNKVKNSRIDYLEKERERLLKQMYESRLFDSDQTSLYYIEKELEDFIPKTEEEKEIDEIVDKILQEKYGQGNKLFTKEKYEAAKQLLLKQTIGDILKDNPEFRPLIERLKDPKEIYDKLNSALIEKRNKAKATPEEIEASIEEGAKTIPEGIDYTSIAKEVYSKNFGESNRLFPKERLDKANEILKKASIESQKLTPSLLGKLDPYAQPEVIEASIAKGIEDAFKSMQDSSEQDTFKKPEMKEEDNEILTNDEKKELIKTMEKSNDKLSGRKYGKGAYSIIRKILDKHKEEGVVFQKKILLEIRWLRWNS